MKTNPTFRKGKIMVSVRVLVCAVVMAWAGTGQAVSLTYLDANFATETVAQDFTGIYQLSMLTGNSAGVVWGALDASGSTIRRVSNGVFDEFPFPGDGIGAVRAKDASTTYAGTKYAGSPSGSAKIYTVDANGNSTEFVTLPANRPGISRMAVSPTNGDILVTVPINSGNQLLKYNSSGVLQWDVASPESGYSAIAYTPSGDIYTSGVLGSIHAIDSTTGASTATGISLPAEFAGFGIGHAWEMAFSSDEYLFSSVGTNTSSILRTSLITGESEVLAQWQFVVPPLQRWLDYREGYGLYINDFDAADLNQSLVSDGFGLSRSFNLGTGTASVLLLQGDFNGEFAGFSASSLTPEPSSVWLLLGLLAWKRKKLALRHSPPNPEKR